MLQDLLILWIVVTALNIAITLSLVVRSAVQRVRTAELQRRVNALEARANGWEDDLSPFQGSESSRIMSRRKAFAEQTRNPKAS